VLRTLQFEMTVTTMRDARVMAIGLHHFGRTLRRSHSRPMFGIKQIPLLFRVAATTEASVGVSTWTIPMPFPLRRKLEGATVHDQCTCGIAISGDSTIYNEEAFQVLLEIERKRFDASAQPFVLVLIDAASPAGQGIAMTAATATKVFATLTHTLRDTDVIGWYRKDRIIGAVLTHLGEAPMADTIAQMKARITRALVGHVPHDVARALKVRLYRPRVRIES
jgi:hypothetical protein